MSNDDRLRRANSWLEAGLAGKTDEEVFIFLWIAFNAAYGTAPNLEEEEKEKDRFNRFMEQIIENDKDKKITYYLNQDSTVLKELLSNKYIYRPYWRSIQKNEFFSERRFDQKNNAILSNAILSKGIDKRSEMPIIREVLLRLYTFRNQIMHGSKTFGSESRGTEQLRAGCKIMKALVPTIIKIMNDNPEKDWGEVAYPLTDE